MTNKEPDRESRFPALACGRGDVGGENEGRSLGAAVLGIHARAVANSACARRSLRVPSSVTWKCQ